MVVLASSLLLTEVFVGKKSSSGCQINGLSNYSILHSYNDLSCTYALA
uniref:Wall-associated receptor kinase galacturonan-binding domain-containing protein n=1 Tax=Setaria viridis TaxID=4556 RepID=A0A4U6T744_SETVI|nr:hypothetical protein SEVIR_9G396950v2 [Setaria viridis]